MKKFLLLALVLQVAQLWGQGTNLKGQLRTLQNEALVGASIRLMSARDSSLVKGESSDAFGNFQFKNLEAGRYFLFITFVSFKDYRSTNFDIFASERERSLPLIVLQAAKNVELKEVVVSAKKPLLEQDVDKTIVNVEAMLGAATSNSYEVLGKAPGVIADESGNIQLNGKNNVLVLIDGRPTYLNGQDLSSYLKSLPGGILAKLELIDNPSSKYDAAGGAVINIVLKKNRTLGLTGNLSSEVSQGIKFRTVDALNLNFNQMKVNWFAGISYGRGANIGDTDIERSFPNPDGNIGLIRNKVSDDYSMRNDAYFLRFGLDYTLSPKTILGAQLRWLSIPRIERDQFSSQTFDSKNQLISSVLGTSEVGVSNKNRIANLNFQHKLKKEGSELSGDFNFVGYGSTSLQNFKNRAEDQTLQLFDYNRENTVNIYNFKTDWAHSLPQKVNLELGIKASWINNDNDTKHVDIIDQNSTINWTKSNHFIYQENLNAAYFNLRKNFKRVGLQAGLRAENTNLSGEQLGNVSVPASEFTQNFTDLFPSAFLSYKLDSLGKNTLSINATRRINRPSVSMFNPFVAFRDNNLYTTGNPGLHPYYQNQVELSFQHRQFLNLRVAYQGAQAMFMNTMEYVDDRFITRPINLSDYTAFFVGLTLTRDLKKWWFVNCSLQRLQSKTAGRIADYSFSVDNTAYRLNLLNQFKMKRDWSADLGFNYQSKEFSNGTIRKGRYIVNATLQKRVWNNKGTWVLGAEDLFFTWLGVTEAVGTNQASVHQTFRFDSRRFRLAFSYRFGNEKYARKRRYQDNSTDEEQRRAN